MTVGSGCCLELQPQTAWALQSCECYQCLSGVSLTDLWWRWLLCFSVVAHLCMFETQAVLLARVQAIMAGDKALANRLVMPARMQAQAVKQALSLACVLVHHC